MNETNYASDDFYLAKDLSKTQQKQIDTVLQLTSEQKQSLENVFSKSAELFNREYNENYKLYPSQIDPVLLSYINPRLFISDSPGLGKTIEAGGTYAYYRLKNKTNNKPVSKVIVVCETIHVLGFENEWKNLGIPLLPLFGGNSKIKKNVQKYAENPDNYDGIVINWDGLKTNEFVKFWLEHYNEFDFGIFDETSCLRNKTSGIYRMADTIINNYKNGLSRVIFLNGTPFEREIYDYYYQFNVLKPKLIPSKSWLDGRYVVKEGKTIHLRQLNPDGTRSVVARNTGEIVDYRNQEELKNRLKYYMIGRTKEDFSKTGSVPNHSYIIHLSPMTAEHRKILKTQRNMSLINSPATSDETAVLNKRTSPKLKDLLEFVPKVIDDRPLIYCVNTKSQHTIVNELTSMGYRVGLINGSCDVEEKDRIVNEFEQGNLDILVFNIKKSLSIKTSSRMLFYDIPTMPQETVQISARIDRDNYEDVRFYDFFGYENSPEISNMIELAYFREDNGNKFAGKQVNIYEQLIQQLIARYGSETMESISDKINEMFNNNKKFEDVQDSIEDLLNI